MTEDNGGLGNTSDLICGLARFFVTCILFFLFFTCDMLFAVVKVEWLLTFFFFFAGLTVFVLLVVDSGVFLCTYDVQKLNAEWVC